MFRRMHVRFSGRDSFPLFDSRSPSLRRGPRGCHPVISVAAAADGAEAVVWRWYDAVVLGEEAGLVRLWEPAHGEVVAHPRHAGLHRQPGTRAYLSAGLPGADWWVAGAAVAVAEDADVELDEVERSAPSMVCGRACPVACRQGGRWASAYPNVVTIYCAGGTVYASGGQTWPTWSRSYVQWGAPPGPGGAGPVGLGLRDGKHAPRKICGTVRPGGSNPFGLSGHSCPNAVPRHAVLTARRYPWVQLMAARNSIAATTTHITTMRTARRPRGTRIPGSVSLFGVVIGVTPPAGIRGSRSPGRWRSGCGEEAARPRRRRPIRWWRRPRW